MIPSPRSTDSPDDMYNSRRSRKRMTSFRAHFVRLLNIESMSYFFLGSNAPFALFLAILLYGQHAFGPGMLDCGAERVLSGDQLPHLRIDLADLGDDRAAAVSRLPARLAAGREAFMAHGTDQALGYK